jgi:hypothetical protein
MANKYKREVGLKLGQRDYTLRPTFEAICEFEERSGLNSFGAMQQIHKGAGASTRTIAAAFWAGIRASREYEDNPAAAPSFSEVGRLVQEQGVSTLIPSFIDFLVKGMSSDADLQRMADNATGKEVTQQSTQKPSPE